MPMKPDEHNRRSAPPVALWQEHAYVPTPGTPANLYEDAFHRSPEHTAQHLPWDAVPSTSTAQQSSTQLFGARQNPGQNIPQTGRAHGVVDLTGQRPVIDLTGEMEVSSPIRNHHSPARSRVLVSGPPANAQPAYLQRMHLPPVRSQPARTPPVINLDSDSE